MVRYAIYLVPPRDSLLWQAGTTWLGRDPETGAQSDTPAVPGYTSTRLRQLTTAARRYGFHATLKAPFRLAVGCTPLQLRQALAAFCGMQIPFNLPPLQMAMLDGFIVLCPQAPCARLEELAFHCVRALDPFRAPPTPDELARRRTAGLTTAQEAALTHYGYPYVGDTFRFHMTLTDRLDAADRERLLPVLTQWFEPALGESVQVKELALFGEPAPQAPLQLLERFALVGIA